MVFGDAVMLCPLGQRGKRVNRIKARKTGAREDKKGRRRDELWQKNGKANLDTNFHARVSVEMHPIAVD